MKIKLLLLGICLSSLSVGCVTQSGKEVAAPTPVVTAPPQVPVSQAPPLLPPEVLDKKIENLGRLLETAKLNEDERTIVTNLQNTYKTLKILNQDSAGKIEVTRQMVVMLFNHLSLLEDRYFQRKQPDAKYYLEAISVLILKKKKIQDSYLSGDYEGVINQCLDLESTFGTDALTPDIGLVFAISLAEKGMLKEATKISQKIIRELESKPDLMNLRVKSLEWQLAQGNKEAAQQIYEKTIDDLDQKQLLVRRAKQLVTGESPSKIVKVENSAKENPPIASNVPKDSPLTGLLKQIEELLKDNQFSKAKVLLTNQWKQAQGADMEIIEQALKSVAFAEEKYQQEEAAKIAQNNETITLAKKLVKDQKYGDALSTLAPLANDPNASPEVKELKEMAENKLINDERNRAATLFSAASTYSDPAKKKEYLLASYQKLKALIEKYPQSNLITKLNSNIQKVKEELQKLGVNPE
jgi:outer membrane protein assembly factor BamD (BamD/ComL family)